MLFVIHINYNKKAFLIVINILEHQMNTYVYILIIVVVSFVRTVEDHP